MSLKKSVKSSVRLLRYTQQHVCRCRFFSDESNIERILKKNDTLKAYKEGSGVKRVFINQIGSHSPIQDSWGEATITHSGDLLFGVFDGNNGIACSQVVAKRIFRYIALSLLPKEVLASFIKSADDRFHHVPIIQSLQDKYFFLENYWKTYDESMYSYARDLLKRDKQLDIKEALINSFERLDGDLSREALEDDSQEKRMLWVGMTGTCATILHIKEKTLTTATAGDAMVVVGTASGEARVLTPEHSVENAKEVARVREEHPGEEVIEDGLLLGSLTSFRSFGNFRYKWSRDILEKKVVPVYGKGMVPEKSQTPPYVTARPDVGQYTLQPEDSFIVMATDGIWDIFPPAKVVEIVSRHKPVSKLKRKLLLPWRKVQTLRKVLRKEDLREEREARESPATQLLYDALVATSKKLHLPKRYMRNIRDDITALVIYLDRDHPHLSAADQPRKLSLPRYALSKLKGAFPMLNIFPSKLYET